MALRVRAAQSRTRVFGRFGRAVARNVPAAGTRRARVNRRRRVTLPMAHRILWGHNLAHFWPQQRAERPVTSHSATNAVLDATRDGGRRGTGWPHSPVFGVERLRTAGVHHVGRMSGPFPPGVANRLLC